ncbi:MAG: dihydroneopterin aldolase [Spiribacter sp.]|jgi:dihydroneopterin aldolase|nr:dihydroneopterin aldolase [Spiribacter sp.]MDR9480799.1 dihydroneopterin aldolase [Spiribacter sp.]
MDTVFINGLELRAVIGVHDWERAFAQRLRIDLALEADIQPAAASDGLNDAIDYAALSERITDYTQQTQFALIEALAEQIATLALEDTRIRRVHLTLYKPGALPAAQSVGVTLTRSQAEAS